MASSEPCCEAVTRRFSSQILVETSPASARSTKCRKSRDVVKPRAVAKAVAGIGVGASESKMARHSGCARAEKVLSSCSVMQASMSTARTRESDTPGAPCGLCRTCDAVNGPLALDARPR